MQKLKNIISSYLILSVLFIFSACTEDPEEPQEAPSFPNKVNIDITKPGEYAEFSFDANYPWNLSSSKIWCKFVQGEDTLSTLSGLAGKHTVKVVLNTNAWEFEGAEAELLMRMLDQTKVVATLGREAKEYLIEAYGNLIGSSEEMVYDSENPIPFLWNVQGTSLSTVKFNIKANFDWQIISYPDWMVLLSQDKVTGRSEELVANSSRYNQDSQLRSEMIGELVIGDKSGVQRAVLPIRYEGIRADIVRFEVPARLPFNFVFDAKGEKNWEKTNDGTSPEEKTDPLEFSVIAKETQGLNFGYFSYVNNEYFLEKEEELWYTTTYPNVDNNWTVQIAVEANEGGSERTSRIAVLPDTVFNNDEIQGNFENMLEANPYSGKVGVKNEYLKYIAIGFTQEAIAQSGFTVTDANGVTYGASLFSTANEDWYGTKNVFMCMIDGNSMPDKLTIEALGYGTDIPDFDDKYRGEETFKKWPWMVPSLDSSNKIVLNNFGGGSTVDPLVLRYKKNGEVYSVLVIIQI